MNKVDGQNNIEWNVDFSSSNVHVTSSHSISDDEQEMVITTIAVDAIEQLHESMTAVNSDSKISPKNWQVLSTPKASSTRQVLNATPQKNIKINSSSYVEIGLEEDEPEFEKQSASIVLTPSLLPNTTYVQELRGKTYQVTNVEVKEEDYSTLDDKRPNNKKFSTWVGAHNQKLHDILTAIGRQIFYCSGSQFEKQLAESTRAFNLYMNDPSRSDPRDYIVLVEPKKSNLGVMQLALKYLHSKPQAYLELGPKQASVFTRYVESLDDKESQHASHPTFPNIVLFDDCSYSGTQITEHVEAIFATFSKRRCRHCQSSPLKVSVIVPFMTEVSKVKLSAVRKANKQSLWVAPSHTIPTIKDLFGTEQLELIKKYYPNWKVEERTLTYFAHKLPNDVSFPKEISQGKIKLVDGEKYDAEKHKDIPFIPVIVTPYKA